ncbi:MAG TPA: hypothetical protein PLZ55_05730 [bacterium]|nr:hypothetical protein [bacterium]
MALNKTFVASQVGHFQVVGQYMMTVPLLFATVPDPPEEVLSFSLIP